LLATLPRNDDVRAEEAAALCFWKRLRDHTGERRAAGQDRIHGDTGAVQPFPRLMPTYPREGKQPRKPGRSSGLIEVEIDGVTVRVFNFERSSALFDS
jgi:hypothetical protein